jgi:3-hydroxyacyl-[acyl-carrier-protein] dehydratase
MQSIFNNFYTIQNQEGENGNFKVNISLDPLHGIFKGHFPGNPVTPGVCMMQIVKEITENITQKKLFLKSASNIKFMAIINPNETPDLILDLVIDEKEDEIKVKNISSFGETIALKMSVNYKIV